MTTQQAQENDAPQPATQPVIRLDPNLFTSDFNALCTVSALGNSWAKHFATAMIASIIYREIIKQQPNSKYFFGGFEKRWKCMTKFQLPDPLPLF